MHHDPAGLQNEEFLAVTRLSLIGDYITWMILDVSLKILRTMEGVTLSLKDSPTGIMAGFYWLYVPRIQPILGTVI